MDQTAMRQRWGFSSKAKGFLSSRGTLASVGRGGLNCIVRTNVSDLQDRHKDRTHFAFDELIFPTVVVLNVFMFVETLNVSAVSRLLACRKGFEQGNYICLVADVEAIYFMQYHKRTLTVLCLEARCTKTHRRDVGVFPQEQGFCFAAERRERTKD